MSEGKINLKLNVAGMAFNFNPSAAEEGIYREAAKLVNRKIEIYKDKLGPKYDGGQTYTAAVAFDAALALLKKSEESNNNNLTQAAKEVIEDIDATLSE